jgi:LysM repeat protein
MKQFTVLLPCAVAILIIASGCQTKLAQSPYGSKEQNWEEFIKTTYPDWDPPQTVPPTDEVRTSHSVQDSPIIVPDTVPDDIQENNTVISDDLEIENTTNVAVEDVTSEFQTYTVKKGDTLWKIARKFYGSGKDWRRIHEANRDSISNPNKIKQGLEIRIPATQ